MAKQWVAPVVLTIVQLLLAAAMVLTLSCLDGAVGDPLYLVIPLFALCVAQSVVGSMLGVLMRARAPVRLAAALAVPVGWYAVSKFFPGWQLEGLFWIGATAVGAGWILRLGGFRLTRGAANDNRGGQFSIMQVVELTAWCALLSGCWRTLPERAHTPHVITCASAVLGCVTVWAALGMSSLLRGSVVPLITFLAICGGTSVLITDRLDAWFGIWMAAVEIFFVATAAVPLRMLGYRLTRPPREIAT
jgi:hypothetical protein